MIESAAQKIRETFDLLPTDTESDWETIATKFGRVGDALTGYAATLREGIRRGGTLARRQVERVIEQARQHAANDGFFASLAESATPESGGLNDAVRTELQRGA